MKVGVGQMFPDLVLTSQDEAHGSKGSSRSRRGNRSTISRPWPSGRTSAASARRSTCMCRPRRWKSPAGCAWKTRSRSRRSGATTRSATRPGSRWCSAPPAAASREAASEARHAAAGRGRRSRRPRTPAASGAGARTARKPAGPRARRRPPRAAPRRAPDGESGTATKRARAEKEVSPATPALQPRSPRLRNDRARADARRRGRGQHRILYWFRTPPGVRVGRAAIDEDAIHLLEQHNPDVQFDWTRILKAADDRPRSQPSGSPSDRPLGRGQEPPRSASPSAASRAARPSTVTSSRRQRRLLRWTSTESAAPEPVGAAEDVTVTAIPEPRPMDRRAGTA